MRKAPANSKNIKSAYILSIKNTSVKFVLGQMNDSENK